MVLSARSQQFNTVNCRANQLSYKISIDGLISIIRNYTEFKATHMKFVGELF